MCIHVFGEPLVHPAIPHVAQVLQPFEIRYRNTACIEIHIRHDQRPLPRKDFFCFWRQRPVSGLPDDLRFHPGRIFPVDHILERGRDQDIALQLQRCPRIFDIGCSREVQDTACLLSVLKDLFFIEPVRMHDGSFEFSQRNDLGATLPEELGGMITHIAQTLYHHRLAFDTRLYLQLGHHIFHMTYLADTIKDTQTRSLATAAYTTLAHRLTGYTTQRIDLARPHAHIGIQDPRHLTLARTIVRSGNIRARADKILFDKFRSIPPRDLLQLIRRIFLGIDADAALGAPKWDIDNSALERHERRQRHDLVEVHTGSKTNAPLRSEE